PTGEGAPAEAAPRSVPTCGWSAGDVPEGTWTAAPDPDSTAASTSALVTTPPGPEPARCLALMPWSFASLRTSGDDTGETCSAGGCGGASGTTAGTAGAAAARLPPNERFFADRVFGSDVP